ncbi:MAG TPA: hypothetical protein VMZ53_00565 [Kofleriaceae bacterium]|nr:hypothetical protein [Kofleriaceae bacterium]
MRSRIITLLLVVVIGVVGWGVYSNVLSDDTAVRQLAEARARAVAGCGAKCVVKKLEGSRGLLNEQLQFEFTEGSKILVECKRAYIAFGAYTCR